jgi:predicted O-methyltransferase YrrM
MTDRERTMQRCYMIPGFMWPIELGWLYDTFQHSKTHAEIGTYCGKSLIASISRMQDANVFYSDSDVVNDSQWVKSVRRATLEAYKPDSVNVVVSALNSIDLARHMREINKTFDSVFVDGCHEFAECHADIEAWLPLVKSGGIIAGHDYWSRDAGVMDAVNDALPNQFQVVAGTRIWFSRR